MVIKCIEIKQYFQQDLFSQAWLSSGSIVFPSKTLVESERETKDQLLSKFNCNERDHACLRRLVSNGSNNLYFISYKNF